MDVGTIFQKVWPMRVGELRILGCVWSYQGKPSDIVSAPLLPVSRDVVSLSPEEEELRRHDLTDLDYAVEYPSGHGREHAGGAGRRWLVWDYAGRERLARWLLNPVEASAEQSSDHQVLLKVKR